MEVSWPENLATTRKMVIEELMVGRELAKQLQRVLANSDGSGFEKDLVMKIIKSFSDTLLIFNVKEGVEVSLISQIQAGFRLDSPCLDTRKSEDYSQESCKSTTTTATPKKKNRRGCYDRRLVILKLSFHFLHFFAQLAFCWEDELAYVVRATWDLISSLISRSLAS